MMSIERIRNLSYYSDLAREDYYFAGGEPCGIWRGQGASILGLQGTVHKETLQRLFAGWNEAGEALVQNAGPKHRAGWDVTFSAPKSVSVLWATAAESVRAVVARCHDQAVEAALEYLEVEAGSTRRGSGGQHHERASLVIAAFQHCTSRAQDPALHTHCLVANVACRDDGTTGTIQSTPLYRHKMAAGAAYRLELAYQLRTNLGVELEARNDLWEIQGIPAEVLQGFSKRRSAILIELQRVGWGTAAAAAVATRTTRNVKAVAARSQLFERWREEASNLSWDWRQAMPSRTVLRAGVAVDGQLRELVQLAVNGITESQAHFAKRQLMRTAACRATEHLLGKVSLAELRQAVDGHLQRSQEIVHLQAAKLERQFTTVGMLAIEADCLASSDQLAQSSRFPVPSQVMTEVLQSRPQIRERPEQVEAIGYLLSTGCLKVLSGIPGTGKSYVMAACREAWERAGYRVFGAALPGKAAQGLAESSGIPSDTLTQRLLDLDPTRRSTKGAPRFRLDGRSVVVVDEMGMVDSRTFQSLLSHVIDAGAKLVLLGDAGQLPPIGAGGPFRALCERYSPPQLKQIERQQDARDVAAIHAIAANKIEEALKSYSERGLLTVLPTRKQAIERLLNDWETAGGTGTPAAHQILVTTNADRQLINARCQARRSRAGFVAAGAALTIPPLKGSAETSGEWVAPGDRVMCLRRAKKLGLENGTVGTVVATNAASLSVCVRPDGSRHDVVVPLKSYPHLTLGYAATVHKAQGATLQNAYVLLGGPLQGRELTYTQLSRAKFRTQLYVDEVEAGPQLTALIRAISKSHAKRLAHELLPAPRSPDADPPANAPTLPTDHRPIHRPRLVERLRLQPPSPSL